MSMSGFFFVVVAAADVVRLLPLFLALPFMEAGKEYCVCML